MCAIDNIPPLDDLEHRKSGCSLRRLTLGILPQSRPRVTSRGLRGEHSTPHCGWIPNSQPYNAFMQVDQKYTNTEVHKFTNTTLHKFTNTEVHKFTNTTLHKYTKTPNFNPRM